MYLGNNAAIRGCQEYFNRCAAAGSPIGATQTPSSYDNAASFNGSTQLLQTTASNISIASGESFSFAGWFQLTANPSTNRGSLVSMISGTQNVLLFIDTFNQAYSFRCRNSTGPVDLSNAIYTTIPLNTYVFVHGQYDAALQKTAVSINNGAFTYSTATGNPISGVSSFIRLNGDGNLAGASFFPGSMSNWGFWKRALTASEVTALWNNGAGRTYASLDSGLRTNLISWWALNGTSTAVSLTDSHTGGNNLTNNGSVTAPNIGPVVTALSDPRQLIIDFAQGIDRLGLWNSMVCWPLRRSQNAGSGLTAFSLGGLGQFNGTLAGSVAPSWTTNGVLNSGGGGQINTTITQAYNAQSIGVVGAQSSPTSGFSYFGANNSTGQNLYWLNPRSGFGGEFRYAGSNIVVSDTSDVTFSLWSTLGSVGSQTTAYKNNVLLGTAASNATTPASTTLSANLILGRENGAFQGTQAFAFVLSVRLSPSDYVLLYTLYRQTLGLGLGLP